jgi:hypothetical protein
METVTLMMDDRAARNGPKFKQARLELDRMEKEFRDMDTLYNIMVVNMGHVEIDRYKIERKVKYCKMLNEFA